MLETVWSKQLSYLLGLDLFGAATTVVTYMLGLGLGAFLASNQRVANHHTPLLLYATLQLGIGVLGLCSVPMLRATGPLFTWVYALDQQPWLFIATRFTITLAILLPATTMMGMTLPLAVASLKHKPNTPHRVTGLLYGINTFGAVAGTLAAAFYLIPRFGLLEASWCAGALDIVLATAILAHTLVNRRGVVRPTSRSQVSTTGHFYLDRWVLLVVGLSGLSALGLELSWFRLLSQVMGPSVNAFSITLATFLFGVALGSALLAALGPAFSSGRHALIAALVWSVVGATIPAFFINQIPLTYLNLWTKWGTQGNAWDLVRTQATTAALVILPASLGLGATFPAALWALSGGSAQSTPESPRPLTAARATGVLYFMNTLGSVLATMSWGFFIIPRLGARGGIQAASVGLVLAVLIALVTARTSTRTRLLTWGLVPALATIVSSLPAVDVRVQNAGFFNAVRAPQARGKVDVRPLRKSASVVFAQEGYGASVAVIRGRHGQNSLDLSYSGKWVASTHPSSIKHLVLLGQLPMLASPSPAERALVIGLGSGVTAGQVLTHPSVRRVDIVEIEPAVLQASRWFDRYSGKPLDDPRSHVIVQDGRTHVVFGRDQYDVITSDPIHPWVKGAANLYTREFYQSASASLTPGGIYCQWIPSSMSQSSFLTIIRTMQSAFADVKLLFSGGEAIALASSRPIDFPSTRFERAFSDPKFRSHLARYHLGDVAAWETLVGRGLRTVPRSVQVERHASRAHLLNTDDNVWLEHALPWEMFRGDRVRPQVFPPLQKNPPAH